MEEGPGARSLGRREGWESWRQTLGSPRKPRCGRGCREVGSPQGKMAARFVRAQDGERPGARVPKGSEEKVFVLGSQDWDFWV